MQNETKSLIKFWLKVFIIGFCAGVAILLNLYCLQDNLYANYAKTVDYGRVREIKETYKPVMAAVFYKGKTSEKRNVSMYFNYPNYYKKQNVRMIVVSNDLNRDNQAIIRRLYKEIKKYNKIKNVTLVYNKNDDWKKHKFILQNVMNVKDVRTLLLSENDLSAERLIDKDLKNPTTLVIFLADLSKGLDEQNSDFLLEEAVYFAQKYFYHISVFDVIDTQIARALEKDYSTLLSLSSKQEKSRLLKQQNNLKMFMENYKDDLLRFFLKNLDNSSKDTIWPQKTPGNYRLFDRGDVYVKLLDEEYSEIFSYGRFGRNESVVLALIDVARKASKKINLKYVKYIKIYLLTELEEIRKENGVPLAQYLDQDDGIYARYENFYTIMLPEDRPDFSENLTDILRHQVGVPVTARDQDIQYYKFKTVETEYEN